MLKKSAKFHLHVYKMADVQSYSWQQFFITKDYNNISGHKQGTSYIYTVVHPLKGLVNSHKE